MTTEEQMKFLIEELQTAFNAEKWDLCWTILHKLRPMSDAKGAVITPAVFAAMNDDLRMVAFDSLLGTLALAVRTARGK